MAAIARALPKYDRIAFIELLCEYQEALPQERPGFSDRFEPDVDLGSVGPEAPYVRDGHPDELTSVGPSRDGRVDGVRWNDQRVSLAKGDVLVCDAESERATEHHDHVFVVAYLSGHGFTLTTVVDEQTGTVVSFASNEKQLAVQHGSLDPKKRAA